jgi:DNA-binding NtrC family response regulator
LERIADPLAMHLVLLSEEREDGQSGLDLIPLVRRAGPESLVVVVAERGNVERAARAVSAGAVDFLVRGEDLGQRVATLVGKLRGMFDVIARNRLLDEDNAALRETLQARLQIIGCSPQIRQLLDQIRRVAAVPRPVLIVGERGTGKESVARAIHLAAGPANRPMITVNCAAFSDALLESELFGHERGAFTGAESTRRGKFEQADGGTLFLDEIGHMSVSFQEKILRVVEYGTFTRVGGAEELRTAARIVAATNRDLPEAIRRGEFLADLYDRLAFETLRVPPLRERKADIEPLAQHFLAQFAKETPAFAGKRLSQAAIEALERYSFPGNVRELKNLIERAAYRDVECEITPEDIGLPPEDDLARSGGTFHQKLDAFARRLIADAMKRAHGNQAQAARDLGLPYHQFRYYWKKYA